MKSLKENLIEATQELKVNFLNQTVIWASAEFERQMKMASWKEVDWCVYFGLVPEKKNAGSHNEFLGMPRGFYNTMQSREYYNKCKNAKSIMRAGKEVFVQKAEKNAIEHYNTSIDKLILRLISKGVVEGKAEIKSGWVGTNLELVVTVGEITVKAWTIIAEGEIQRPHYRYLVK